MTDELQGTSLRTMNQSWQFLKNLGNPMSLRRRWATGCKFQPPARRAQARHRATDCISQVSKHREIGRMKFQSGFDLQTKRLFGERPDSHNVVKEQPVVEPEEDNS